MISNLHICYYQYYSLRRVSPPSMRCQYTVFGYKHFLTTINYFRRLYTTFDGHILLQTATYCLQRPHITLDGYILLTAAIYYFRRLYITFDGYILLSALPDCDFVRIQDFLAIFCICRLKASLEFNINLLALIQFCFFCSSMVFSINFNVPF